MGGQDVVPVLVFLLVTLLFALVYVVIMLSISATTGSTTRATTLAIGFFLVMELFWDAVPIAVVYVSNGFSMPQQFPDWIFPIMHVPPSTAYVLALVTVLPEVESLAPAQTGAGFDAVYATPELGFVVLAFWLVVPAAVGYYLFDNADI